MLDTHAGVDIPSEMASDKNLPCLRQMYMQRWEKSTFKSDSPDGGHDSGSGHLISYRTKGKLLLFTGLSFFHV